MVLSLGYVVSSSFIPGKKKKNGGTLEDLRFFLFMVVEGSGM
jgi:hypothetical protein